MLGDYSSFVLVVVDLFNYLPIQLFTYLFIQIIRYNKVKKITSFLPNQ
jgi:hypothetical protein